MGILDRADVESLRPAERWSCRACGRNGFSSHLDREPTRRVDRCPDCGGLMDVWPSTDPEPVTYSKLAAETYAEKADRLGTTVADLVLGAEPPAKSDDSLPLALRLLRDAEAPGDQ